MNRWWGSIICGMCLLLPTLLPAQRPTEKELLFFQGFIDAAGEVNLRLEQDGNALSGRLSFLSSGLHFELNGRKEGRHIWLHEQNRTGEVCGHIEGQFVQDRLLGHWYNRDRSIGLPFELQSAPRASLEEKGCATERWVAGYGGALPGGQARMMLSQAPGADLSGTFSYAGLRQSWRLEQMPSSNPVKLVIKDEKGHPQGVLSVYHLQPGKKVKLRCEGLIDGSLEGELKAETHWPGKCKSYWGYAVQYSVNYYAPENEPLADFLDAQAEEWMSRCRRKAGGKEQEYTAAADRARFRYQAWFEPTYLSPVFVSGFWQWIGPEGEETVAVNYDLSRRKAIGWDDLFREGVKEEKIIRKNVKKALRKRPEYKEKAFRKHLRKTAFDYFSVQAEGLQVFSEFDPVFGRFSVLIPWDQLKDDLAVPSLISRQF